MKHGLAWLAISAGLALCAAASHAWSDLFWRLMEFASGDGPASGPYKGYWSWEGLQGRATMLAVLLLAVTLPATWIVRGLHSAGGSWRITILASCFAWALVLQRNSGGQQWGLPWSACLLEALPTALALSALSHKLWPVEPLRIRASTWISTCALLLTLLAFWSDGLTVESLLTLSVAITLSLPVWLPAALGRRFPQSAKAFGVLFLAGALVLLLHDAWTSERQPIETLLFCMPLIWIGLAHVSGWSWGQSHLSQAKKLEPQP